jgi:glycerophosphoryl diester phosphodiesterase
VTTSLVASRVPRSVQVIAHRARCDENVPENSFRGALRAIELGCDAVEVDVRRTADGLLVLMHDRTSSRTTSVTPDPTGARHRRVERVSSTEIRRLRLRTSDGRVTHDQVPMVLDVVDAVRACGGWTLLDVKRAGMRNSLVWSTLVDQLRRLSAVALAHVVVQSTDLGGLCLLKASVPSLRVVGVSWLPAGTRFADELDGFSQAKWALRRPEALNAPRGNSLFSWVVNDGVAMDRALRLGVTGVITDRPSEMLSHRLACLGARPSAVREGVINRAPR